MGERVGQIAKVPEVKQSNLNSRVRRTKRLQSMDTPVDRILYLQRTAGNQAVSRLMKSGALQAKLKIGQPGDVYEQEADRVADVVMRMPEPGVQRQVEPEDEEEETLQSKPLTNQITPLVQVQRQEETEEEEETLQAKPLAKEITPLVQRQVEPEEEEEMRRQVEEKVEEEENMQAQGAPPQSQTVTPAIESRIKSLKGSGQPLSNSTREFFEPRFGTNFNQVRLHMDPQAAEIAKFVNAKAFTTGNEVVFGAGQYSPETSNGKRLLAHELTHVVQQNIPAKASALTSLNIKNASMIQRTPLFWNEPISKNMGTLETRAEGNLRDWLIASHQAINDLIDDVLKANLDKKQWSGFTTALFGNIIWAASAFGPTKTAIFAISLVGIAIGSLGSIPAPIKINKNTIKDLMNEYVENVYRTLRSKLPDAVDKYTNQNPQKTGKQAISDFLRSNFKKGLYSLSGNISMINITAVRKSMYQQALVLLKQTKKFEVTFDKFSLIGEPAFFAQRGMNEGVAIDANREIRKEMPKVLTYQQKNPAYGVLFVIFFDVNSMRYPGKQRSKKYHIIYKIYAYKTKQDAINKFRNTNYITSVPPKKWIRSHSFLWIPPLR